MANGANANAKDKYGKTALIHGICIQDYSKVKLCPHINLSKASSGNCDIEIVKLLVSNGANMYIKDSIEGQNALIWGI